MRTITVYESDDDGQVVTTIESTVEAKIAITVDVTKKQFEDIFNNGNMTYPTRLIRNYKVLLGE